MEVRKTEPKDLDAVMDIYAGARAFMKEHGNPRQWGDTWPPRELIEKDIEAGRSYVCDNNGEIAAVFYYYQDENADPLYQNIEEGNWIEDGVYGVVHRIASSNSVKGAASFCIEWAYSQCHHLRVDTHPDNLVMQNFLIKNHFQRRGIVHVEQDDMPRIAFERMEKTFPIQKQLFNLRDSSYKAFNHNLIPNIPSASVIGVRTPDLRKYAKELKDTDLATELLSQLPHTYFEENQLHSFIISDMKDYDSCLNEINRFLPYIDNWATCDQCSPKVFKKNTNQLIHEVKKWIQSDHPYTVRFAIKVLMNHYLKENYQPEYLDMVSNVSMEHYYVQMMQAWFFATALAHQYDDTLKILESNRLPLWVHNKTIQKAVESYRISDEQKEYLKQIKR